MNWKKIYVIHQNTKQGTIGVNLKGLSFKVTDGEFKVGDILAIEDSEFGYQMCVSRVSSIGVHYAEFITDNVTGIFSPNLSVLRIGSAVDDPIGINPENITLTGDKPEDVFIVLNRIKTPDGTILTSHSTHDYKTYIDANGHEYMVDGGHSYLRRNKVDEAPYEELSVYSDAPFDVIRESLHRGGRGKDGTEPLKYIPLSEMSDEWVKACITYNEERGAGDAYPTQMYRRELLYREEHNISIAD